MVEPFGDPGVWGGHDAAEKCAVVVRLTTEDDAPGIQRLRDCMRQLHGDLWFFGGEREAESIGSGLHFVAEKAGVIVGTAAVVRHDTNIFELANALVQNDLRGCGVLTAFSKAAAWRMSRFSSSPRDRLFVAFKKAATHLATSFARRGYEHVDTVDPNAAQLLSGCGDCSSAQSSGLADMEEGLATCCSAFMELPRKRWVSCSGVPAVPGGADGPPRPRIVFSLEQVGGSGGVGGAEVEPRFFAPVHPVETPPQRQRRTHQAVFTAPQAICCPEPLRS